MHRFVTRKSLGISSWFGVSCPGAYSRGSFTPALSCRSEAGMACIEFSSLGDYCDCKLIDTVEIMSIPFFELAPPLNITSRPKRKAVAKIWRNMNDRLPAQAAAVRMYPAHFVDSCRFMLPLRYLQVPTSTFRHFGSSRQPAADLTDRR